MAERISSQPRQISEQERLHHPITPGVIADLQDVHSEMESRSGDHRHLFVQISPEYMHLAAIAKVFEVVDDFKQNGIYLSQKSVRFLEEYLKVPTTLVTEEPSPGRLNSLPDDHPVFSGDLGSEREPGLALRQAPIKSEQAQGKARMTTDYESRNEHVIFGE